ncbi:MAG: ABC transporter permease [Streptosporangiaceae bacterium]
MTMMTRSRFSRFAVALGNEVRKGLLVAWSERVQILLELPMFAAFILLIGPVLGRGQHGGVLVRWSLNSGTTSVLVFWFVPFMFFYMQNVKLFWRLLGEIQSGTLEQVYLSPLPSWLTVAAARAVAALAESVIVAAATYGIVSAFVPLHYHWTASALLPAALLVLAVTGFSLVTAGMTLVWKRIQLVNDTVLVVVMIFSAAALPLITVPAWFARLSRLFPVTAGVGGLYNSLLGHISATALWGTGGLAWELATATAYLAAGIGAFRLFEHVARTRGSLARY